MALLTVKWAGTVERAPPSEARHPNLSVEPSEGSADGARVEVPKAGGEDEDEDHNFYWGRGRKKQGGADSVLRGGSLSCEGGDHQGGLLYFGGVCIFALTPKDDQNQLGVSSL